MYLSIGINDKENLIFGDNTRKSSNNNLPQLEEKSKVMDDKQKPDAASNPIFKRTTTMHQTVSASSNKASLAATQKRDKVAFLDNLREAKKIVKSNSKKIYFLFI